MKQLLALLLSFVTICPISWADGEKVQEITKGEPAPFSGYLFNPPAEKFVRLNDQKLELYTDRIKLLEDQNKALEGKVNLWMDQAEKASALAVANNNDSFWVKIGFFALGALVTTGLAFAVKGATR